MVQFYGGRSVPLHDKIAQKGLVATRDPKVHKITWLDAVSRFNKEFTGKRSTELQHAQGQRDFNAFLRLQGRSDSTLHETTRGDAKAFEGYLVNRRKPCLAKVTVQKNVRE